MKSAASQDRTRTDLIMDQYPDVSIKNPEREWRGAGGSIQIAINHGNQKCPTQWKKYLSDGSNKANLASFLLQEWQKPEYFVRFADFGLLFVTHGMECHKLTAGENGIDCNRVDELCARQEEADTRILLHASHAASNGHDCIAIKSPDTDVAVLACTFSHSINAKMLFCIDTKQRRRYLDMTAIGHSLGAWNAVHSWEKAKGRRSITVESDPNMCAAMMMVGNSFGHDDERQQGCSRFVCSLYGNNGEDTDRVRYKLFCSKNAQTCNLPPTRDALKYHVARANYQACIWHNSLEAR